MSMNAALSGLAAAQADISTISNNIANVSTIGFRGSRVEFADVFNASPYTTSRTTIGSGTQLVRVAQNFGQGNIVTTGNRLDLAIEGQGFFAVQSGASTANAPSDLHFTRAGAFEMNAKGNITNASGETLLGWPVSGDGSVGSIAGPSWALISASARRWSAAPRAAPTATRFWKTPPRSAARRPSSPAVATSPSRRSTGRSRTTSTRKNRTWPIDGRVSRRAA